MREGSSFKLYPRGFLGALLKERVQQENRLEQNNTGFVPVKVATFKKANGINDFNHEVEEHYAADIKCSADSNSFAFRRSVLTVALAAFGTDRFDHWYKAQFESPVVSELHRNFLDDTLKFISVGRRDVSLETWSAVLGVTNDTSAGALSEAACEFFGLTSPGVTRLERNTALVDVLQSWVSQPGGFEDLLGTLHLLFGQV